MKYCREFEKNYMQVECKDEKYLDSFAYKMAATNRIKNLLECNIRFINQKTYLYYDISSLKSLEMLYSSNGITKTDIIDVMKAIKNISLELKEYLMDNKYLFLSSETIFYNLNTKEYYFMLAPVF